MERLDRQQSRQRGLGAALGVAKSAVRRGAKPVAAAALVAFVYGGGLASVVEEVRSVLSLNVGTARAGRAEAIDGFTLGAMVPKADSPGCAWGPPAPPEFVLFERGMVA